MQRNSETSEYKQNTQLNTLLTSLALKFYRNGKTSKQFMITKDLCIHQIFEMQVERSPESIAIVFKGTQLIYQQLNKQANPLAHYLRALGLGTVVLVVSCLEPSLEMIVVILSIIKGEGAYVFLDRAYSRESVELSY
jgi:non-ribosomal peptide synthetase component F